MQDNARLQILSSVPNSKPKKDARLTLRITSASKDALQACADEKDRTLNWLAQHIFDAWLAKQTKPKR